jgi:DNA-directed RNA polymerase subunit RPC12/RpoP
VTARRSFADEGTLMTVSCPDEMMQVGHRSASQSYAPRRQWLSEVLRPLNLGSITMSDEAFPRSRWEVRANLVCTLCARTVGAARGSNAQPLTLTSVRLVDANHADAVRRLRCPYCSGRLWLQDHEEVRSDHHGLSADDLRPRRGRPRKPGRAS